MRLRSLVRVTAAAVLLLPLLIVATGFAYDPAPSPLRWTRGTAVVDGTRLGFHQAGQGPDVVLIHGSMGSAEDFEPVLAALSRAHRVTAVDRPCFGASECRGPDATISQPSLVAVMTDLLRIERGQKVLEVGVGGGYHTAILAEMTPEVMSVEFHANVASAARKILGRLGYKAVKVNVADGYYGWRPGAPYDAILVRMAIPDVSSALFEQLKPGGRLIAPVGPDTGPQQLIVFHKGADGRITETSVMEVIFRALPGGTRL